MDLPVAMKSNLHSVLFAPAETRLWVANAGLGQEPAVTQPYHEFQLSELLTHIPDSTAPRLLERAKPPRKLRNSRLAA